ADKGGAAQARPLWLTHFLGRRLRYRFGFGWNLAHDLLRPLVGSEPLEASLPHQPVAAPAAEGDLGDQFGPDEMGALAPGCRNVLHRRRLHLAPLQLRPDPLEFGRAETAAAAAAIGEPVAFAHCKKERRERLALHVGIGPADHDEFLALPAFHLEPAPRPAG